MLAGQSILDKYMWWKIMYSNIVQYGSEGSEVILVPINYEFWMKCYSKGICNFTALFALRVIGVCRSEVKVTCAFEQV